MRFVNFSKKIVAVEKSKVMIRKEQRTARAGRTPTSTERRAHRTAHFAAARNPATCIYFSAVRRMRLTQSAVVSKEGICKTVYHDNLKEATTPVRKKRHEKEQTASRASVGPNK